ncbi:putative speedy protein E7 [Balaenoptera ricei]|uniref:putative speedy protein E7 n=1 Tax=Balaenoptera ricei TaxID=2746895 RepID=UPI0028BEEDC4|nr:putative speedy protein E7 [Balaenoptera ricei]
MAPSVTHAPWWPPAAPTVCQQVIKDIDDQSFTFVSTEVPPRQKDPWKEAEESSFSLAKKAAQDGSPLASSSASPEAVSEQRTRRMRGQKRKRLMDVKGAAQESSPLASNPTSSEAVSELKSWKKCGQRRNMWTVNHVEGTKLRMNKRRSSYRPEDQEDFYRLLEDPVIQSFLEADIFLKVSDKYLLSMVVEYFGRVGLPGHLYNRIHFFLALYIASDMEEDNPTSKRSIFQFLLGREHWPDRYKEFLKVKVEFFHAMGHQAWVTPDLCEEIQAQNPHHWVWSRARQCAP